MPTPTIPAIAKNTGLDISPISADPNALALLPMAVNAPWTPPDTLVMFIILVPKRPFKPIAFRIDCS